SRATHLQVSLVADSASYFAGAAQSHRRSPSPSGIVVCCPYNSRGSTELKHHPVLIPTAVYVINLEWSGSALAPRAGIAVGREDTLSRVHSPSLRHVPAAALSTTTPLHAEGRERAMPRHRSTTTWCVNAWTRRACRSVLLAAVL